MEILIVSSMWPSRGNAIRGIFIEEQVQGFLNLGHNVTVLVPFPYRKYEEGKLINSCKGLKDIQALPYIDLPQRRVPSSLGYMFNASCCGRVLRKYLSREVNRHYDLLMMHDIRYVGASYRYWRDSICAQDVMLTVHGFDSFLISHSRQKKLSSELKILWASVGMVIAVGTPILNYLEMLGVPSSMVAKVANGTSVRVSPELRSLAGKLIMLSVCNLVDWKGIDFNIRAFAQVVKRHSKTALEYRIVGDGVERARLEKLASELGVVGGVRFLGRLSRENTLKEFAECDFFVLPSWKEPFGIVYLEAMAQAKPVVACRGAGAEDFVIDDMNGVLIPQKDVNALVCAIESLVVDSERRERLGLAARQCAEVMDWESNVKRILELRPSR